MSSQPINDETAFFLGNCIQEQKGRVDNFFLPPKLLDPTHNVRELTIPFQLVLFDTLLPDNLLDKMWYP